jgi:3-deoxy-D-manno-octulosonate 8-phosphate phosphatase (KDO 8-P phosphatase)
VREDEKRTDMDFYKSNLLYLCDQKGVSLSEFEDLIYIPKVRVVDPTPPELVRIAEYFGLSLDTLVKKDLKLFDRTRKADIRLTVLDVDGTLTDGGMFYTEKGDYIKKFNSKDGLAIKRKTAAGIRFGIISHAFASGAVHDRANLLGIQHVYVGQDKKLDVLQKWCDELKISFSQVAFVGDDINDLEIMQAVGVAACPRDSVSQIKAVSHIILSKNGGDGCVREFIDEWLQ